MQVTALEDVLKTGQGRVWISEYGSGPAYKPYYMGCMAMEGITKDEGTPTPIYSPSETQYEKFVVVGTVPGEEGLPTTSLRQRMGTRNPLLELKCAFGLQAHFGSCGSPLDFNGGWSMVLAMEMSRIGSRATEALVALEPGEGASILASADVVAERFYPIWPLGFGQKAVAQALLEVVAVTVCDVAQCGECGVMSAGFNNIYAIAKSSAGSPGLPAEMIYSEDGGLTWYDEDIDSLVAATGVVTDVFCVGDYVVVLCPTATGADAGIHFCEKAVPGTWAQVSTGFATGGEPYAGFSVLPTHTWIVGANGYVYFTDDPTSGVTTQDAGSATTEDLKSIHMLNTNEGLAVGDNNAVIYTINGGASWTGVTGPLPAVGLLTCWMRSQYEWMVGSQTGRLFYTRNQGQTWTEKTFPGSTYAGEVRAIAFSPSESAMVGYMAWKPGAPATQGRIYRTIDGGYSWYVLPEGRGTMPANDRFNDVGVSIEPNFVVGVGLALTPSTAGVIVIGQ